jgi:hypothetical protein
LHAQTPPQRRRGRYPRRYNSARCGSIYKLVFISPNISGEATDKMYGVIANNSAKRFTAVLEV